MSAAATFACVVAGSAFGFIIGDGLVNLINERLIRRIVREEIDEDHVRHSGFVGLEADAYRRALKGYREAASIKSGNPDRVRPYE